VKPWCNLESPTYRRLPQDHDGGSKCIDVIVGAPTILNVGLLLLTPQIELLALGLAIARQTCKIERDTFLSSD
jgi:hypothetical protein